MISDKRWRKAAAGNKDKKVPTIGENIFEVCKKRVSFVFAPLWDMDIDILTGIKISVIARLIMWFSRKLKNGYLLSSFNSLTRRKMYSSSIYCLAQMLPVRADWQKFLISWRQFINIYLYLFKLVFTLLRVFFIDTLIDLRIAIAATKQIDPSGAGDCVERAACAWAASFLRYGTYGARVWLALGTVFHITIMCL